MRALFVVLTLLAAVLSQDFQQGTTPVAPAPLDYMCPMDPDVRSATPGKCPRCGMTLRLGIPEPVEYPMELKMVPPVPKAGAPVDLFFKVRDPESGAQVSKFEIVHEKLFHLFVVSQDLSYFIHDHPVLQPDSSFRYTAKLPQPGLYRLLGDFYPTNATPQLIAKTIIVPGGGPLATAKLDPDLSPKHGENMEVELVMDPPQPIAGMKTLMFFRVKPAEGLEQYLGAWGHMLAASDDLIDMIHTHPFLADGGPQIQFNLIFPRARTYRVWVQFQRKGVVNTAAFTVPVSELK
jgi:hypothetical protein